MRERRFAVVIGINDYEISPLNFCENDALSIKQKLINNCDFNEQDIYVITSTSSNPNKEITGKYKEALRLISQEFTPTKDSIVFYFAGHGFYKEEQSIILFHDSEYPIVEVFNDISILKPKVQFYIIDSCQSGGKVLTRGEQNALLQDSLIDKYIENSDGAMLLYACGSNQFARETSEMQHGLLTYEFLNAIDKDDLYDEDGILTPSRIQDFVLKQTSKNSNFEQVPVVENRISGIYPFAIKKLNEEKVTVKELAEPVVRERNQKLLYNKESRLKLQNFVATEVMKKLNKSLETIETNYKRVSINDIYELHLEGISKLVEKLVTNARENKVSPIYDIYSTLEKRNPNYITEKLSASLSMFQTFRPKNIPEYIIEHSIDSINEYITMDINTFYSDDITSVSFGCGIIVYQSKWGLVLTTLVFKIEWDGEKDSILDVILQNNYPFLIGDSSYETVEKLEVKEFLNIDKTILKWDEEREKELKDFINSSISLH